MIRIFIIREVLIRIWNLLEYSVARRNVKSTLSSLLSRI